MHITGVLVLYVFIWLTPFQNPYLREFKLVFQVTSSTPSCTYFQLLCQLIYFARSLHFHFSPARPLCSKPINKLPCLTLLFVFAFVYVRV